MAITVAFRGPRKLTIVRDLSRTREYLTRCYAANTMIGAAATVLLGALLVAAIVTLARGGHFVVVFGLFGFGSILSYVFKAVSKQRIRPFHLGATLRQDHARAGAELYDISENSNLSKRIEPPLGTALENAADAALKALDAADNLPKSQREFAQEVKSGIHEAMHEVVVLVLPFVRPVGLGKSKHEEQIQHLDAGAPIKEVEMLTEKLVTLRVSLTGGEDQPLRLDQTLARLQELKKAEAELDQTLLH
jgi:hypothetical protein